MDLNDLIANAETTSSALQQETLAELVHPSGEDGVDAVIALADDHVAAMSALMNALRGD
jgi:hypothetical protein